MENIVDKFGHIVIPPKIRNQHNMERELKSGSRKR